jgi:hypothetical protein
MQKTYTSKKTAILLDKIGFDLGSNSNCRFYPEDGFEECPIGIYAPRLDVAQKWLRENLKIYVTVDYFPDEWKEEGYPFFEWKIRSKKLGVYGNISGHADTYEKALENGIQRALINYLQGML